LKPGLVDPKNPSEKSVTDLKDLVETGGTVAEPYVSTLLGVVLTLTADKSKTVATAAEACAKAIVSASTPSAIKVILFQLFEISKSLKLKWQTRVLALQLIHSLVVTAPKNIAQCMGEIVPVLSECMGDARKEVAKAAEDALLNACSTVDNKDIEKFIPALVSSIARPVEVPECVHKLSATTFVQQVEPPTLSVMVPVLQRGLTERQTAIKRKACIIIDNMCKLVEDPEHVAPFLPKLLPGLERAKEEVSDPECRAVAVKAYATLFRASGEGKVKEFVKTDPAQLVPTIKEFLVSTANGAVVPDAIIEFVSQTSAFLNGCKQFEYDDWQKGVEVYLGASLNKDASTAVTKAFLSKMFEEQKKKEVVVDEDEGEDLCNCEFSLAYGGKILLNNARLHLKRGRRYGLCGPNGAGKTTLMRAIANEQLEGFPPASELKTVYVEHDIDGDRAELNVVEYVLAEKSLKVTREEVQKTLSSVGFTDVMQGSLITSLSGGWKMKLALARAMLLNADIMLLDEPTNHLDVHNVRWIINYLTSLTTVTSMVVSHDSKFLDAVCTDIIHYEGFKLKRYKGNLSEFVKQRPEARSYYELSAATIKFSFPEPGYLEGVKTKDKAVLKMAHVGFTYPNTTRQILKDVSIFVSLSSRVAVVGPNGAGKSTMIKILTGELEADEGTVWKHPNLRIAYIAQHAFHHLEEHLDETPSQYIQWRFAGGEDKEALQKATSQISEEEKKAMESAQLIDGQKMVVEAVLNRRKLKNSYEYEVQWVGKGVDKNQWLPRQWLIDRGFSKLVDQVDAREAAAAGAHTKPLTAANIQKHLEAMGLESEFSLHSRIRGLSGGQKVKTVLAACMWNNPHILVLDEPTNYLDRDSLGALAGAINEFGGGVLMISHNSEFTSALCKEQWMVDNGQLKVVGESWAVPTKIERKEEAEDYVDAMGNTIKVAQKKALSRQELKRKEKEKAARRKKGEEVSDDEEEI
jgi:elongation factor 3